MNHVVSSFPHDVEVRCPFFESAHPFRNDRLNNETVKRKSDVFSFLNGSTFSNGKNCVRFRIEDSRARRNSEDRVDREVSRFWFGTSFSGKVRIVFNEVDKGSSRSDLHYRTSYEYFCAVSRADNWV